MKTFLMGLSALPLLLAPAEAAYIGVATGAGGGPAGAPPGDFDSFATGYSLHPDAVALPRIGEANRVSAPTVDAPAGHFGTPRGTVVDDDKLVFVDGLAVVGIFDGSDIAADPDAADIFPGSGRNPEVDGIRVAATPLPAALGLFGLAVAGLGLLGPCRRTVC